MTKESKQRTTLNDLYGDKIETLQKHNNQQSEVISGLRLERNEASDRASKFEKRFDTSENENRQFRQDNSFLREQAKFMEGQLIGFKDGVEMMQTGQKKPPMQLINEMRDMCDTVAKAYAPKERYSERNGYRG